MACLILQICLSRYFNRVEKNGERSTNYALLFVCNNVPAIVTTSTVTTTVGAIGEARYQLAT